MYAYVHICKILEILKITYNLGPVFLRIDGTFIIMNKILRDILVVSFNVSESLDLWAQS